METVLCSAIKYRDQIYRGHRHGHAMQAMRDELSWYMTGQEMIEVRNEMAQGFLTTRGRFVDRKEGYRLQIAAGIPSMLEGTKNARAAYAGGELFSEDLY